MPKAGWALQLLRHCANRLSASFLHCEQAAAREGTARDACKLHCMHVCIACVHPRGILEKVFSACHQGRQVGAKAQKKSFGVFFFFHHMSGFWQLLGSLSATLQKGCSHKPFVHFKRESGGCKNNHPMFGILLQKPFSVGPSLQVCWVLLGPMKTSWPSPCKWAR